jgi:hypothetical protein
MPVQPQMPAAPPAVPAAAKSCAVCGTPLTLLDAPTYPTCARQACRWAYQTSPPEARCTECGRLLTGEQRADRLCASAACRRARLAAVVAETGRQAEQRRRAAEELELQGLALRAEAAAALGVAEPAAFPLVVTPSLGDDARTRRLPPRRRRALREHVGRLVDAALAARAGGASPNGAAAGAPAAAERDERPAPAVGALLGAACATCRGFCCHRGGDKAYLTVDTVARWLDAHPEVDRDAAVEAYAARAGSTTYVDSCIYHRRAGCALPREMRSDTCNNFFCGPLVELRRALAGGAPPRAFFAASLDGRIEAAAFADGPAVRVARRRP